MLNMMENNENWVWRGYFCRTDPFGKNASTKIRTESHIKPGKRKDQKTAEKRKTTENGTGRSGVTTNKQESVEVEEE